MCTVGPVYCEFYYNEFLYIQIIIVIAKISLYRIPAYNEQISFGSFYS